jgi:hypothetical protein
MAPNAGLLSHLCLETHYLTLDLYRNRRGTGLFPGHDETGSPRRFR